MTMKPRTMKTSSRFFWKSVGVAVLIAGSGLGYTTYLQSRVSAAQRDCEAASQADLANFNKQHGKETGPWTIYQTAGYRCDPEKLDNIVDADMPEAQSKLVNVYNEANRRNENVFYGIALLTLLVGVLPAFWYFFLARLSELVTAIRGK